MNKTCPKCGETKPLGAFGKNRSNKKGVQSYCKSCFSEYARRRYAANPEKDRENSRRWKKANPEKIREYQRCWRKANLEKERETGRRRYATTPEKQLERSRQYRAANPEKCRELVRRWRKANPDKCSIIQHRREAKKRNLPHDLTSEQWQMTLETFDRRCAYCRKPQSETGPLAQDHVIPVTAGGGYTFGNVVGACQLCNSSKKDRCWNEWMLGKGYNAAVFQATMESLDVV